MNLILQGSQRDRLIVDTVAMCGALDTDQITLLFFRDIKSGRRKAQERLLKMTQRGLLARQRLFAGETYAYYAGKQSGRPDHLIATNWAYIWLLKRLKSGERPIRWEREQDYGILQCDGFFGWENRFAKCHEFAFVEMDLSDNPFDKVVRYNQLFARKAFGGKWWAALAHRFPEIVCVTYSESRKQLIDDCIRTQNTSNLRFSVRLLDDIKREALSWQKH